MESETLEQDRPSRRHENLTSEVSQFVKLTYVKGTEMNS